MFEMQKKSWTFAILIGLCFNVAKRLFRDEITAENQIRVPDYYNQRRADLVEQYLNGTFTVNYQQVSDDGCWYGDSNHKDIGIIIPFKKRESHLKILLPWLQYFLQSLRINYCLFVVEQVDNGRFNKAYLMNAGFHFM